MTELHHAADRGSLTWAVRDSLLRYITVIAGGTCAVEGGAIMGDDGTFTFPLTHAQRVGEQWQLSFAGSVRFLAHRGFLDVSIADPLVVIGAEGGLLSARTDDQGTVTAIAATGAAAPETTDADLHWPAISALLLESGAELFGGAYPAGTDMAPLTIRASLDS